MHPPPGYAALHTEEAGVCSAADCLLLLLLLMMILHMGACRIKAVGAGTITLDRPLCFTFGAKWSSSIHLEQPTMQDSGVEKLTIRFK
jgi:hypothetical protein